jgi:hypothetical protein
MLTDLPYFVKMLGILVRAKSLVLKTDPMKNADCYQVIEERRRIDVKGCQDSRSDADGKRFWMTMIDGDTSRCVNAKQR